MSKAAEEDKLVYGITKENIWLYALVEKLIQKVKYGQVTFTMRVHNGEVEDVGVQEFSRYKKPKKT